MAIETPGAGSRPATCPAISSSNVNAVSVTSRSSRSVRTPATFGLRGTLPTNSSDARFRADTLTATVPSGPAAVHAARSARPRRSIHVVKDPKLATTYVANRREPAGWPRRTVMSPNSACGAVKLAIRTDVSLLRAARRRDSWTACPPSDEHQLLGTQRAPSEIGTLVSVGPVMTSRVPPSRLMPETREACWASRWCRSRVSGWTSGT